jgi:SAM-dependent methyltransferase
MDPFDTFKAAQKAGWAHFAPLQVFTTTSAARLVEHAGIRAGMRVLDVACGTGVVAVTAARLGARVTGLDLTPELLEAARANSRIAGLEIDWHEGDVEHLPFDAGTFDAVVSQFGHMFAPRPDVATAQILDVAAGALHRPHVRAGRTVRACSPAGRVASPAMGRPRDGPRAARRRGPGHRVRPRPD